MAGETCTRGACVSSVLCTRMLVCTAQGSGRGRGGGEAEAGQARCATCLWRKFTRGQKGQNGLHLTFVPRVKKTPPRRSSLRVCGLSCPSRCPIAVPYTTERRQSLPACGAAATPSSRLQTWAKTHTFVCLYISNNKPCERLQSNLWIMYLRFPMKVPHLHRQVHVQVFLQHLLKHLLQHLLQHPLALQHLQFQILHGHGDLQAHIYNQRGHHNRRANAVQAFSVRSWRTRVQHHLKHLPLLHATMQHL